MQIIGIYKTTEKYIIFPYSITSKKKPVPTAPFTFVNFNDFPEVIANCILKTFNSIEYDLPDDCKDPKTRTKIFLDNIGFKSLLDLHKTAHYCSIELKNDFLTFTPTLNKISEKIFLFLNTKKEVIQVNASPADVVFTLTKIFGKCE